MRKVILGILVTSMLIFTNTAIYGASIQIEVDGLGIVSDVPPQIKNKRTMVPLRIISENLGAKVGWSNSQVSISKGDMQIVLKPNSKEAKKNGQTELLDATTYVHNDRVMVPLRFIAETFGCEVDYKDHVVVITTKSLSKRFVSFEGQIAIITEDVTLQDPYVVTEDSNNKLLYQKINNDVFSLKRNDMVIVIEEDDTKYRIMQAFGDIPLVRGLIEKGKLSYDTSLFKDNGNQAIVSGAMSYDGMSGKEKGVQYGVGKVLERKGEWAKISLPMEERDYWFKSDSLSYDFDTTVLDYVNKNDTHQFWDSLVEVPENNLGKEDEIYWPYIGDDMMQKVDALIQRHGPELLFNGLESTNVYSQYYCINRLVEYYNHDDIRTRAIDEITPFLKSKNKTLKDGAQFAISVLDKKFDSSYIVSGIDDIKIFPLFNNYSDYGSYNELWMIKGDKLSKLHSFNGIQAYIDKEEPIKISPQKDKIAVQTSSRKSSSFNIIDLKTGKVSPEIMKQAVEKVARDYKDYNNTYPDGAYSWGHTLKWTSNDTVEFEARLAYNYMEIIEEVTVRYNVLSDSLEYTNKKI